MSEDARQPDERVFETVDQVIDYLVETGWKATAPTVYRHRKQGKFLSKDDGRFRQKDVDRYAKTWLKRQSTGKKVKELEDELQRKKLEQELKNLEIEFKRKEHQLGREQGKYIEREKMEIELAARAGILEAGLKHWIQSRVAEWIRTAGGDLKKAGELINAMIRDLDEHINSYAQAKEFEVVIDADETDIQTEEEESHE